MAKRLLAIELCVVISLMAGQVYAAPQMTQAENNAVEPVKVVKHINTPKANKNSHMGQKTATKHTQTDKVITQAEQKCENTVNEYELDLLARLIEQEAGADYCSDTLRAYVGSVALNRVADERFPDTLEGVVYQDGQYYCAMVGSIESPASERSIRIAEELLTGGSQLPAECVWQAEFEQGEGTYYTEGRVFICY